MFIYRLRPRSPSELALRRCGHQLGLLGNQGYDGPGNVGCESEIVDHAAGTARVVSKPVRGVLERVEIFVRVPEVRQRILDDQEGRIAFIEERVIVARGLAVDNSIVDDQGRDIIGRRLLIGLGQATEGGCLDWASSSASMTVCGYSL